MTVVRVKGFSKCGLWILLLGIGIGLILVTNIYSDYLKCHFNYVSLLDNFPQEPRCEVPQRVAKQDINHNGTPDALDIVKGARREVKKGTVYDGSYHQSGYPPEGKGACTDVIWRAFKTAGYKLKVMVDEDIESAPQAYGPTGLNPEPSIDFRRVQNLQVFFIRHAQQLTTEVKPGEVNNLVEWQPGDIVVFGPPLEHIGIISDRRCRDGVPLVIHNSGPTAAEGDYLLHWPSKITYHFRFIENN
ncbi:MAG: DUF1287 domain-containing protein [Syntrophomonas sp.]